LATAAAAWKEAFRLRLTTWRERTKRSAATGGS
jgi:hypothetical protein